MRRENIIEASYATLQNHGLVHDEARERADWDAVTRAILEHTTSPR